MPIARVMHAHRTSERVQRLLGRVEAEGGLPESAGIAVAVVGGDSVLYQGTFGKRDRVHALPVTPTTLFAIGSVTKAFTAAAFLASEERGTLRLEAPMNESRAVIPLSDNSISRRLSVADILSHRSGVPPHDFLWYFGGFSSSALARRIRHLTLIPDGFRRYFAYSTLMYACLPEVFEHLLGKTFGEVLSDELLKPLGMRRSYLPAAPGLAQEECAIPHQGGVEPQSPSRLLSIAAAGGMHSSLEDMSKWLSFQLAHGCMPAGRRLLSAESMARMHSQHSTIEVLNPLLCRGLEWIEGDASYGFGWLLGRAFGRRAVYHTGFVNGFSTVVVLVPSEDLGCVVLSNVNVSSTPGIIVRELLAHHFGERLASSGEGGSPGPSAVPSDPEASVKSNSIEGVYVSEAYGTIKALRTSEGVALDYCGHLWPLTLHDANRATAHLSAMGFQIPLPVAVQGDALSIPLAFDARVPPEHFSRVS